MCDDNRLEEHMQKNTIIIIICIALYSRTNIQKRTLTKIVLSLSQIPLYAIHGLTACPNSILYQITVAAVDF